MVRYHIKVSISPNIPFQPNGFTMLHDSKKGQEEILEKIKSKLKELLSYDYMK